MADSRKTGSDQPNWIARLRTPNVTREAKASVQEQFAEHLALHALTEEEVLYPAAILVGDIIRLRLAQK